MSVKPKKTCAQCGKDFYLWCTPREYPSRKRAQTENGDKTLYFCGDTCKRQYEKENPTRTYNRW